MKVFVLLCLATVAFAEKRNFLGGIGDLLGGGGGELGSAAAKIAACEATLHEAACKQCCDSSFSGLFGFAERPACEAACKILPAPPAKRQFGWIGEATKFAVCEAKLNEADCVQCCDSTFSGLLGFAERPACHAACKILPAPPAKRQVWLGEATKFAVCEAKLHEDACVQCCDSTFTGLLGFAERPACHAACRILPAPPAKRQVWLGEAAKFAVCEAKLHEDACKQCCDSTFSGLLGFAERPACHAACRVLPN